MLPDRKPRSSCSRPGARGGRRSRRGGRRRAGGGEQGADGADVEVGGAGGVAAGQGQLEAELVEPVGAGEVGQGPSPTSGPSGVRTAAARPATPAAGRRCRRGGGRLRPRRPRPAPVEIGGGEVGVLQDPVDEGADVGAAGHGGQQRGDGPEAGLVGGRAVGRHSGDEGMASVSSGSSTVTVSSGSLATRASWLPAVMAVYEVRRQWGSRIRSNPAARSAAPARRPGPRPAAGAGPLHAHAALGQRASSSKRAATASSAGTLVPLGATFPSAPGRRAGGRGRSGGCRTSPPTTPRPGAGPG